MTLLARAPGQDEGAAPEISVTETDPEVLDKSVAEAIALANAHLIERQEADGWWKGELETNVTMDAEDVLLRHFLGILDNDIIAAAAGRIRSQQRPDGPWATFYGGPGELSATIEAYVALRLAGDDPGEPHMARAAAWARQHGGVEAARVFTHVWLAMVGRWDWEKLPAVPPELVFLPADWPLSIWSFACWARQTIVALSVISAHRPARPLPFEIEELKSGRPPRPRRLNALGVALVALDKALHYYESIPDESWPKRLIRGAALREAERWIVARQEADGSWGGIQPPMVYSTIALVLQGYPLDHPVITAALRGLDAFAVDDESGRRIEACQSPVWDTALAVTALLDAGTANDDPSIKLARDWLLQKEVTVVGDWSVRRPGLAPGGWAFEFQNVHYPDIDDTAEVVIALRRRPWPTRTATPPAGGPWTGLSACSARTGAGPLSTPTTPPSCRPNCRSSISGWSPTLLPPTSPPTWSRCWRRRAGRPGGKPCSGAWTGSRATRSPTVRTGAAGV